MLENDLSQTLLLEDEQKQILGARQNTDMSSLVVFKVGIPVACFAAFFLLISLRTADAFPVVASLPPEGEKRRPEMRLLLAGYLLI